MSNDCSDIGCSASGDRRSDISGDGSGSSSGDESSTGSSNGVGSETSCVVTGRIYSSGDRSSSQAADVR